MKEDVYLTRDLYEASLLVACQQKLLRLELEKEKKGRSFWFIFNDHSACQKLLDTYWRRELEVNAKAYTDAIRSLKDRLFSMERNLKT